MGVALTNCPDCRCRLVRSTTMVEGATVLCCRGCGVFWVEGCDQAVQAGPGLRDTLALLAGNVKASQTADDAVRDTPWSDPRWDHRETIYE